MPEGFADHLKAGGESYERGELAAARMHFEKALELDPGSNLARYNLGVVYRDLELSEDAWIQFLEVIARDGRMAGAFNNMAILEERLGYYRAAEAHYRRAIALKSDFPDAHFNLGMLLLRLGRFPEGFRECEWRWQTSRFTPFRVPHPLWDGRPAARDAAGPQRAGRGRRHPVRALPPHRGRALRSPALLLPREPLLALPRDCRASPSCAGRARSRSPSSTPTSRS